ncbi:MAG: hypothetical protein H5T60_06925 [Anaerolineae bacterium]|nr:hypothetical protein [Anaerolineae bacterium]
MEVRVYLQAVWKSMQWLAIGVVAAAGVSVLLSLFILRPVYRATATMIVNVNDPLSNTTGYTAALASERMAQTYAQLVTEPGILQETLQRAGLSLRPELFRESVTVTAPPNTAVIRVSVEDNNPTRSAELANTLVKVFGERVQTWQEEAGIARTASSPEVASLVEQQRQYLANTLDAYASTYANLMGIYVELTSQMQSIRPVPAALLSEQELNELGLSLRTQMTDTLQAINTLEDRLAKLETTPPTAQFSPAEWRDELARLENQLYQYRSLYTELLNIKWTMSQLEPTRPPADQVTAQMSTVDSLINSVRAKIASLQEELTKHAQAAPAPDALSRQDIAAQTETLRQELSARREAYINWLNGYISYLQLRQANLELPAVEVDVKELDTQRKQIVQEAAVVWEQIQDLRKRLDSFDEVHYEPAGPPIILAEAALPPARPVRPNPLLNGVVAGTAALVIGLLIVILREYFRLVAETPIGAEEQE